MSALFLEPNVNLVYWNYDRERGVYLFWSSGNIFDSFLRGPPKSEETIYINDAKIRQRTSNRSIGDWNSVNRKALVEVIQDEVIVFNRAGCNMC